MDFSWLEGKASNTYSQFGEDGVLEAIFFVIRATNKWCLECGASDGIFFSNTRKLLDDGWQGILIEADQDAYNRLVANSEKYEGRARCVYGRIDKNARLETELTSHGVPLDIDLVIIDVDGQDYHLFNSLFRYRPRVVVVEFDGNAPPEFIPDLGGQGQAGLQAMRDLARGKLYTEVYRSFSNLVLVRQPDDRLLDTATLKLHLGGRLP